MTTGADGAFHAFWISNSAGASELYTARVNVEGKVAPAGGEVAGLNNVTSRLEFQYTLSVWNPRTSTVSLRYQILNTSQDTIVLPLKLRVATLTSDLGVPSLILEGGRTGRAGSILEVSHVLPSGKLPPGRTTREASLQVKLDEVIDLGEGSRDVGHLVLKAYSGMQPPAADSASRR